ncbi:hypothetical protein WJX74_001868 [Apatococcus lobatus]|uniref:Uncharacterized protein n=1 Tax=Apatococcus lobatus TaxID=904363 RepID=A0AAW1S2X5_9CHLO
MDTGCRCFGIAASSRRPVKRYNALVPECFPRDPPPVNQAPDPAQERKYKKLCEYLDHNPERIPKASRRLARTINKHLVSRKHGYVCLAAQTYIYLLDRLQPSDSSLLAKELILEHVAKAPTPVRSPGVPEGTAHPHVYSVVGLLLTQRNQELRVLGLQLLTHFIDAQADAVCLNGIERFMPLLCTEALQERAGFSMRLGQGGAPGGLTTPAAMQSVAALAAFLRLLGRTNQTSTDLTQIQATIQEFMLRVKAGNSQPASGAATPTGPVPSGPAEEQRVAQQAFTALARLIKNAAVGDDIVLAALHFLWQRGAWQQAGPHTHLQTLIVSTLSQVCAESQQSFLLFQLLLQHAATTRPFPERQLNGLMAVVVATAEGNGLLTGVLAAPALTLVMQTLPKISASAPEAVQKSIGAVGDMAVSHMAGAAGAMPMLEAISACLSAINSRGDGSDQEGSEGLLLISVAASQMRNPPAQGRFVHMFPVELIRQLAIVLRRGNDIRRELAHAILASLLSKDPSATLGPHQAALLLSGTWHELAHQSNGPDAYALAQRVVVEVMRRSLPPALLHAAHFLLALRAEAVDAAALASGQAPQQTGAASVSGAGSSRLSGLTPVRICYVIMVYNSCMGHLLRRLKLSTSHSEAFLAINELVVRDENLAYEALQKMLQSLQAQQAGGEEGRARLPQLISSSRVLQEAGWPDAQSRLMQPFSPAPLTDDPTWRLPAPQAPSSSNRRTPSGTRQSGAMSSVSSLAMYPLTTASAEEIANLELRALPRFDDLVAVSQQQGYGHNAPSVAASVGGASVASNFQDVASECQGTAEDLRHALKMAACIVASPVKLAPVSADVFEGEQGAFCLSAHRPWLLMASA